jgi:hypothetical protein
MLNAIYEAASARSCNAQSADPQLVGGSLEEVDEEQWLRHAGAIDMVSDQRTRKPRRASDLLPELSAARRSGIKDRCRPARVPVPSLW